MMNVARVSLALAALILTPVAAQAASFSIATSTRRFITPNTQGASLANADYSTGFFGVPDEYRSYFRFDLPAFTGTVTSARLRLNAGTLSSRSFPISYQITSLASVGDFSAVGTGTLYGARDFVFADRNTLVSIDFNSAGVAGLTSGGSFLVGGRVTNRPAGAIHAMFGATTGAVVTLDFDTAVAQVPEPASWAMLIAGFGLIGAMMRRRRTAIA